MYCVGDKVVHPMHGAGTIEEIKELISDLEKAKVDIVTIGQYIQPSKNHLEVEKYYTPEEFNKLAEYVKSNSNIIPVSHPLARSSYKAFESYKLALDKMNKN